MLLIQYLYSIHLVVCNFRNDVIVCDFGRTLDFRRCDVTGLNIYLASIDWDLDFHGCCIDVAGTNFYDILFTGFDGFLPLRKTKVSRISPPWYNNELRALENRKAKAHKKYIR